MRAEGGVERRADAVQERHPRRRLLVADVGVGDLPEAGDLPADAAAAAEVAALDQRRGRAALEEAVAVGVDERRLQGRAGGRGGARLVAAAGNGQQPEEEDREPLHHSSLSPATTGSRSTRRATSAVAAAVSASRPSSTMAT